MSRGFSGTRLSDGIIGSFFFSMSNNLRPVLQVQGERRPPPAARVCSFPGANTHKNQKKQVGLCYKVKNTDSMDKQ